MNRSDIETVFAVLLAEDDCTDLSDDGIYKIRPLTKTVNNQMAEYGFSLSLFGVLALRCVYKGKWQHHIEVSSLCADYIGMSDSMVPSGEFYKIPISSSDELSPICTEIYKYCKSNLRGQFDCCSLFQQCSDNRTCVSPLKQRALLCRYRKKLENGIIYFGDNRNV